MIASILPYFPQIKSREKHLINKSLEGLENFKQLTKDNDVVGVGVPDSSDISRPLVKFDLCQKFTKIENFPVPPSHLK